jgi:hypothetical protein
MSFGFGRRAFPGRFVAEGTLAIDIATLLWAMRFERPEGARGELDCTIVLSGFTAYVVFPCSLNGFVLIATRQSHLKPFEYRAIPRFTEAEALLNETLNLYG